MSGAGGEVPSCSVIVPTYRRRSQLERCLAALERLDYPADRLEVVVVVDGDGADPGALERRFRGRLRVRVEHQPHRGPAAARNTGALAARGELLAFTDDDCRPDPGWLRLLATRSAAQAGAAVGGFTVNALRENPYATASQLIIDAGYDHYNSDPQRSRFFTSNNLAVPAGAFAALGGFDSSLATSEDRELCERWLGSGRRMVYEPRAVVRHLRDMTLTSFVRQHFAYGRGAYRFHRLRGPGSLRRELSLSYYGSLARRPFRREQGDKALGVLLLLAVWQLANAAGYAFELALERGGLERD